MTLIACGQFCATNDVLSNLAICRNLAARAAAAGAKALFLPEASDYIASSPTESLSLLPQSTTLFLPGLLLTASTHSLTIIAGIHSPSPTTPSLLRNTLVYINAHGEITSTYHKLHLFDITLPSVTLLESSTTEAGDSLTSPIATDFGLLGLQICFDLRFPEGARALVNQGAEVLTYPSAFTVPTGRAHWEVLLRARAVEGQCFVVAAAQGGRHNEKRVSWGGAMVVNPWGEVVARCAQGDQAGEPEICLAEVDLGLVHRVRVECPLRRRTDVYAEL
ncbi:putative nitrilase [Pyronema omphalodes]|nr:putative nitrilase [Pyronema omphalodes]